MTTFTPGPWTNIKGLISSASNCVVRMGCITNEHDANLIAASPQLFDLTVRLTAELAQQIKDIGGCDHSVGICICDLVRLQDEAEALIKQIRGEQ